MKTTTNIFKGITKVIIIIIILPITLLLSILSLFQLLGDWDSDEILLVEKWSKFIINW